MFAPLGRASGAGGDFLVARAGIGFEKFQTILMLLGANLFYGIYLGRCLLLVELAEDRNIIGKTLLG